MKLLLVAACLVACGKSGNDVPKGPRTQVTYSLDLDLALDERGGALRQDIEAALADKKLRAAVRTTIAPAGGVTVVPEDPASRQAIDEYLKATYKDGIAPRECEPNAGTGAICIELTEAHAMAIKKAALENAVKTIRSRLEAVEVAHARVAEQGGQIIVSFPENDEQGAKIRDLIARTGKLEFKVVDDNAPFMRQVYAQVGATGANGDPVDPRAQRDEIRAEVDQWRPDEGGGLRTDFYLTARDREETLSSDEAKRIGCFARAKAGVDRDGRQRRTPARAGARRAGDRAEGRRAPGAAARRVRDDDRQVIRRTAVNLRRFPAARAL